MFTLYRHNNKNELENAGSAWRRVHAGTQPDPGNYQNAIPRAHADFARAHGVQHTEAEAQLSEPCGRCATVMNPRLGIAETQNLQAAIVAFNHVAHREPTFNVPQEQARQPAASNDSVHRATLAVAALKRPIMDANSLAASPPRYAAITMCDVSEATLATKATNFQLDGLSVKYFITETTKTELVSWINGHKIEAVLGGCYQRMFPTNHFITGIYRLVDFTTQQVTAHGVHAPTGGNVSGAGNIYVRHAQLRWVGNANSSYGDAFQNIANAASQDGCYYLAFAVPIEVNGVHIGGAPPTFAPPAIDDDGSQLYAPTIETLKRVSIVPIDVSAPIDPDAVLKQEELLLSNNAQWPLPDFALGQGSVEITGKLYGIDDKHTPNVEKDIGDTMHTLTMSPKSIRWGAGSPYKAKQLALAPAFAAITATWLDRTTVATITQAANWLGGSRTLEIEPAVRTAMRTAANTPIDLTRYYVRLWAMYYDAVSAYVDDRPYAPRATSPAATRVITCETYSAWAAQLCSVTTTSATPLYYDTMGMAASEDVFPVLAVVVDRAIEVSPLAGWLWPTISGAALITNARSQHSREANIDYCSILASINWLSAATDTASQAAYARSTMMSFAMRPHGAGLIGKKAHGMAFEVRMPPASTKGLLLQPLSLWGTTADVKTDQAFELEDITHWLRTTAAHGQLYHYLATMCVARTSVPTWWPRRYKRMVTGHMNSHLTHLKTGWLPILRAAAYKNAMGPTFSFYGALKVYPANTATTEVIRGAEPPNAYTIMPWLTKVPAIDCAAAIVAKISIVASTDDIVCKMPLRLTTVATSLQPELLANCLQVAGVTTGLVLANPSIGTINSVAWLDQPLVNAAHVFPIYQPRNEVAVPVVYFDNPSQVWRLRQAILATQVLTWHVSSAAWSQDTDGGRDASAPLPYARPTPPLGLAGGLARVQHQGVPDSANAPARALTPDTESGNTTTSEVDAASVLATLALPPRAVRDAAKTDDTVLRTVVSLATGQKVWRSAAMEALPTWNYPPSIANDNEALNWLGDSLTKCFMGCGDAAADEACHRIRLATTEQVRLNTARILSSIVSAAHDDVGTSHDDDVQSTIESPTQLDEQAKNSTGQYSDTGQADAPVAEVAALGQAPVTGGTPITQRRPDGSTQTPAQHASVLQDLVLDISQ